MADKTIYGKINWTSGIVEFIDTPSNHNGYMNWTTGVVDVVIDSVTYSGKINWNTGIFEAIVPDPTPDSIDVIASGITACGASTPPNGSYTLDFNETSGQYEYSETNLLVVVELGVAGQVYIGNGDDFIALSWFSYYGDISRGNTYNNSNECWMPERIGEDGTIEIL